MIDYQETMLPEFTKPYFRDGAEERDDDDPQPVWSYDRWGVRCQLHGDEARMLRFYRRLTPENQTIMRNWIRSQNGGES